MPKKKKTRSAEDARQAEAEELDRMLSQGGSEIQTKSIPTADLRVVGFLAHPTKPKAVLLARKLSTWFEKKLSREVMVAPGTRIESLVRSADFIVSVGGDGTLLGLARHMMDRAVPVFGINMGHLGFLTGARPKEAEAVLQELFSKTHIEVEQRLMLRARVLRHGQYLDTTFQALNDVVINREGLTRYLKVEVSVGDETFSHFFGDGVIIATPTGSTAYSMSAGGPVVLPTLGDIIVTAICPHASALRSTVVPGDQVVRVRVFSDQKTDRVLLTADGASNFELEWGDIVECTRAPIYLPLVKSSRRKYFSVLREKFKIPLESQKRI